MVPRKLKWHHAMPHVPMQAQLASRQFQVVICMHCPMQDQMALVQAQTVPCKLSWLHAGPDVSLQAKGPCASLLVPVQVPAIPHQLQCPSLPPQVSGSRLRLLQVTAADSGEYVCRVSSGATTKEASVMVTIQPSGASSYRE